MKMSNTRDVGILLQIPTTVFVEKIAVKEEMVFFNHSISERNIVVGTKLYDSDGKEIKGENIFIIGEHYELLMSGDVVLFGPDKKVGLFN